MGEGLQVAMAQAWGKVQVVFEDDEVRTIAFASPLDVATELIFLISFQLRRNLKC